MLEDGCRPDEIEMYCLQQLRGRYSAPFVANRLTYQELNMLTKLNALLGYMALPRQNPKLRWEARKEQTLFFDLNSATDNHSCAQLHHISAQR